MKPNKLICMDKTTFYFGCFFSILIIYIFYDKFTSLPPKQDCECPVVKTEKIKDKSDIVVIDRPTQIIDRITDDPQQFKTGPERYFMGGRLPPSIRSRGYPSEYQNIGILTNVDPNKRDVKPLYGRRIYRGANMWNYYTLLNDFIQVKIPIEVQSNNCIDDRGCSEIMDGSTVKINGETYKVDLYPYTDFRYNPNVI